MVTVMEPPEQNSASPAAARPERAAGGAVTDPRKTPSPADRDVIPTIGSDQEFRAVYGDLRKVAQRLLANERTGVSIQATSLVHEAWMRLRDHEGCWSNERHYFHTAVRAMRRYLIDRARERKALRRGGDRNRMAFEDLDWACFDLPVLREIPDEGLDGLDEAFAALERSQPRAAEVAQLRWIAGLTIEEVAEVIGVSLDTVKRDWRFARAWLRSRLLGDGADTPEE